MTAGVSSVQDIVKILKAKEAPATFFPVARAVPPPEDLALDRGGRLPDREPQLEPRQPREMSANKAAADIQRSTRLIERIIPGATVPVLRPPGGALDQTLMRVARESGMQGGA